jgi:hypothetical protein
LYPAISFTLFAYSLIGYLSSNIASLQILDQGKNIFKLN